MPGKMNFLRFTAVFLPMILLTGSLFVFAQDFPESVLKLEHNPMDKAIQGRRYEAMVPDTLDLADRMGLAVNALTNVWCPELKWAMYFNVDLLSGTGVLSNLRMYDSYLNIPPKFIEALEVKATARLREDHFRGLRAIDGLKGLTRRILIYLGAQARPELTTAAVPLGIDRRRGHPYRNGKAARKPMLSSRIAGRRPAREVEEQLLAAGKPQLPPRTTRSPEPELQTGSAPVASSLVWNPRSQTSSHHSQTFPCMS